MASSSDSTSNPLVTRKLSLWRRIILTLRLRFIKAVTTAALKIISLPGIRNKNELPTYVKTYSVQPNLYNRVFIPKSYKTGDVLPLYLDIHGGGFALFSPVIDDLFCSRFANDNKIIVVSLDYPKAPDHKYPAGVNALVDTIKAVLADEALSYDKTKVAIGGFSAGGNLSLAVAQRKELRGKFGGVAAIYPPTDFVTKGPEKMKTRPTGGPADPLKNLVSMFNYGYTAVGQDLTDPMLSINYAERENFPPKLCIVACEYDLLCKEAERFAEKMAGVGSGEKTGSDLLWEKNGVRWEKVLGEVHGFDQAPSFGKARIRVEKRRKLMWDGVAKWLFQEVYA